MEAFLQGRVSKPKSTDKAASTSTAKQKTERKHIPWVEKYRPRKVEDIAFQDEVVSVLKKCLSGADLPNLLFYGPPGTGKTSSILAVSRELFGLDLMKERVLELNASDDRGIQVIRDKVKTFSQHTASGVRPDGTPCPPFKIVILDEADSMTRSAQAALRRTMEKQSKTTRFCLICNYISRIIEPLTSRCSKFRFKALTNSTIKSKLQYVVEKEKITFKDKVLDSIVSMSEGDLRRAITYLQSSHRLKGGGEVTQGDIYEIAGMIPESCIMDLIKACKSNSYDKLQLTVKGICAEGYSVSQFLYQLYDVLVSHDELTDKQKSILCDRLGIIDKRLIDGADEFLQLMDIACLIMRQFA